MMAPVGALNVTAAAGPLIAALTRMSLSAIKLRLWALLQLTGSTTVMAPAPVSLALEVDTTTDEDPSALCSSDAQQRNR
jgi:hypothetical protein